jgi:hypothetical protein
MREKLNDVFRRHRVLGKLEQRVRIEGFTQPGDPLRLDYGYQNGCAVSFIRFLCGATSRRPRCWPTPPSAFTPAIPGRRSRPSPRSSPPADNPRHQFVEKLFAEQNIRIVAMNRVEGFAEELRLQLN